MEVIVKVIMTLMRMRKEGNKKLEKSRSCVTRITYAPQAALTAVGPFSKWKYKHPLLTRMMCNSNFTFNSTTWPDGGKTMILISQITKLMDQIWRSRLWWWRQYWSNDDDNDDEMPKTLMTFTRSKWAPLYFWHGANMFFCIASLFNWAHSQCNAKYSVRQN